MGGWVWEGYEYLAANMALLGRCGMGRAPDICTCVVATFLLTLKYACSCLQTWRGSIPLMSTLSKLISLCH